MKALTTRISTHATLPRLSLSLPQQACLAFAVDDCAGGALTTAGDFYVSALGDVQALTAKVKATVADVAGGASWIVAQVRPSPT